MAKKTPLGAEIHITASFIDSYIDQNITECRGCELTFIEGRTLGFVNQNGGKMLTSELLSYFHVSKASMSQTLTSLLNKKMITMDVDQTDRRCKIVALTDKGKYTAIKSDEFFDDMDNKIESNLTDDELDEFYSLLKKIRQNLGCKY